MPTRSTIGNKVQKGESFNYTAVVKDESGTAIDLTDAAVDVTLTYYRTDTNAAINSRNAQAVVTAGVASNEHTVDASGNLTWKAVPDDTSFSQTADTDVVARYTITYDDGAAVERTGIHEVIFTIENLPNVS